MNFEIKGNIGLILGDEEAIEINAKEGKIVLNIRKISGIKKLFRIAKEFSSEEKTKKENKKDKKENKKERSEVLRFLKKQGYILSIKLKGITIIKDLESSSLAKLTNLI